MFELTQDADSTFAGGTPAVPGKHPTTSVDFGIVTGRKNSL